MPKSKKIKLRISDPTESNSDYQRRKMGSSGKEKFSVLSINRPEDENKIKHVLEKTEEACENLKELASHNKSEE